MINTLVLFFGEIRGTPEHWKYIYDNIVKPNNADVIMNLVIYNKDYFENYSTCEKESIKYYHGNKGVHLYPPRELFDIFQPVCFKCDTKPKSYTLEYFDQIKYNLNHIYSGTVNNNFDENVIKNTYYTIMSQCEQRSAAMKLKNDYEKYNNFKYDNIFFTRLDINPTKEIIINHKLTNILARSYHNWISEQLIIGPSETMDIFIKTFEVIPKLHIQYCNTEHHFMQNEYFISLFLQKNNIEVEFYDVPLSYNVAETPNGLKRFNFSYI